MPFNRRTLQQIAASVKLDVQGSLASTAAFWRYSFERGIANAVAGVSHQLHAHLDWIARQIDPTTADEDILETVHAAPSGIYRKPAVKAKIRATAPGVNGTVVTAGWLWQRSDATRYTVDANATVSGGSATIDLTAELAGKDANVDVGTVLQIGSPIAGISGSATVTEITVLGEDVESPASLLSRYLAYRRTPPRGGAEGDYEEWTKQVPGVPLAWEYPARQGLGTVTIYALHKDETTDVVTALSPTKLAEIATYLDQPGRQPTTVEAKIYTPTLQAIPMTIAIKPNTTAVQNAVLTELRALYARVGHPGGLTIPLSNIDEAISVAAGEDNHVMTIPAGDVVVPFGSFPVPGTITWSTLP